jgi:hypothetical protein
MNALSADIMCVSRSMICAVVAVFILAIILMTDVTSHGGLLFILIPILAIGFSVIFEKKVARVYDELNAQIYKGALLYPQRTGRRRDSSEPMLVMRINLPRLRKARESFVPVRALPSSWMLYIIHARCD